jgi:hypothetical protein
MDQNGPNGLGSADPDQCGAEGSHGAFGDGPVFAYVPFCSPRDDRDSGLVCDVRAAYCQGAAVYRLVWRSWPVPNTAGYG